MRLSGHRLLIFVNMSDSGSLILLVVLLTSRGVCSNVADEIPQ